MAKKPDTSKMARERGRARRQAEVPGASSQARCGVNASMVSRPSDEHRCQIDWEPVPTEPDSDLAHLGARHYLRGINQHDPAGTVRACDECGKTWVARYPWRNIFVATWVPEGRLARWLRERREKRGAA